MKLFSGINARRSLAAIGLVASLAAAPLANAADKASRSLATCQYAVIPSGLIKADSDSITLTPSDQHVVEGFLKAHGQNETSWKSCAAGGRVFGLRVSAEPSDKGARILMVGSKQEGLLDDLVMHVSSINVPVASGFLFRAPIHTDDGHDGIVKGSL